jgi:aspartate aminotransferase-like enzyme
MIGHRGSGIQTLIKGIDERLRPLFMTEHPVLISTSSATGLMEAAVRNAVVGGRVLSLVNGAFSNRFADIGRSCGFEVDTWDVDWGGVHSADQLDAKLSKDAYDAVTLSQSETSTGALQDLEAISAVVRAHPDTLLLVDSVTGVPGVETRTDEWGIDFILTGSQKAMALPPGLAFGVASEAMLERSMKAPGKGWYFDIDRLMKQLALHQTPSTPAISLLHALDVQLERIATEGLQARWDRHLAMQARTMTWIDEMKASGVPIGPFAEEGHRSPTVTTISMPGGEGAPSLVAELKERGWVIGGGYGPLKQSTIRIGHMGDHTVEQLEGLLDVMTEVVG